MAQRIVSSWDWDNLRYDYYRVPGDMSIGGWRPLTGLGVAQGGSSSKSVGVDLEAALPELPAGAVHLGFGSRAVGTVVKPIRRYEYLGMDTSQQRGVAPRPAQTQPLGRFVYTVFKGGPRGVGEIVVQPDGTAISVPGTSTGVPGRSGGSREVAMDALVQMSNVVNTRVTALKAKMGATTYSALFLGLMLGRRFPGFSSTLSWIVGIAGMIKLADAARKGRLADELPPFARLQAQAEQAVQTPTQIPVTIPMQGLGRLPRR